jgi:ABC-type transporter Mla subunit MlaD
MLEKRVTRQVWPVAFVVVSVIAVALLTLFSSAADSIGVGDFTPTVFAYLPLARRDAAQTNVELPNSVIHRGWVQCNV